MVLALVVVLAAAPVEPDDRGLRGGFVRQAPRPRADPRIRIDLQFLGGLGVARPRVYQYTDGATTLSFAGGLGWVVGASLAPGFAVNPDAICGVAGCFPTGRAFGFCASVSLSYAWW